MAEVRDVRIKLDLELVKKLYSEGLSLKDVGIKLGVSPNTISRRLNNLSISKRDGTFQKGHAPVPGCEKGWFKKGVPSKAWKGGLRFTRGYREVWCHSRQKYIKEHRYIMELHLGRKLNKDELVHHINKNRLDNRIENLQIMSNSEHATLHGTENYKNKVGTIYKKNKKINLS